MQVIITSLYMQGGKAQAHCDAVPHRGSCAVDQLGILCGPQHLHVVPSLRVLFYLSHLVWMDSLDMLGHGSLTSISCSSVPYICYEFMLA